MYKVIIYFLIPVPKEMIILKFDEYIFRQFYSSFMQNSRFKKLINSEMCLKVSFIIFIMESEVGISKLFSI